MAAIVLVSLLLLLFRPETEAAVDWTIKSNASGLEVVETVVDSIQQSCIFPDDRLMLRRIAAVESDDGQAPKTFTVPHFYGGIWQIDKTSFVQTKSSANDMIYKLINSTFKIDWKTADYVDLVKPLYSGLAARLRIASYYRSSDLPQDITAQAQYWAQHFTTRSWESLASAVELYKNASARKVKVCSSPKADVIFVLDSSGSITSHNFNNVRQFVVNVVQSFVIGRDRVRVALIQFSNVARIEFNLTAYNTTAQMVNVASNIPYLDSGTNTVAGLQALESVVNSEGRLGDAVPVVAILMTDGQSNDKPATLREAARIHQTLAKNLTVFSVGVGSGIDSNELKAIASIPPCQHVFHLASFNDVNAFAYQIMKKSCEVPAPISGNQVVTVKLLAGEKTYVEATARRRRRSAEDKRSAIEFTAKVKKGKERSRGKVYLSWTARKPSAAKHDAILEVGGSNGNEAKATIPFPKRKLHKSGRRNRRDVSINSTADDNVYDYDYDYDTDSQETLYVAVEGLGDEEDGNSFDLSYDVVELDVTDEPETTTSSTTSLSGTTAAAAVSSEILLLLSLFHFVSHWI